MDQAEGVTISGGEPFDQPEALRALLQNLRRRTATDVLVYSGYTFSEIESLVNESSGLIDVLISEPYVEQATQTSPLRGSDNQVMHFLTELGRKRFASFDRKIRSEDRRFDVMFDDNGSVWIAGVPQRDDFRRFKRSLQAAGHIGQFSDSP